VKNSNSEAESSAPGYIHRWRSSFLVGGLPFEVKQPIYKGYKGYNATTEQAMKEAKDIVNGKVQAKTYSSASELFEDLENFE